MGKISVIIPMYNAEQYISKCIESLYRQKNVTIEPIIIDDSSQDGSVKICENWKEKWPEIKLLRTAHLGVSHARNKGIEYSTGEYISFVDADDWVEDDFFYSLLKEMLKENADMVDGGCVKDYGEYNNIYRKKDGRKIFNNETAIIDVFSFSGWHNIGWEVWCKLYSKELIGEIRFDGDIDVAEDMLFLWKVLLKSKKVLSIPHYGYHYMMSDNSAVRNKYNPKKLSSIIARKRMMEDYDCVPKIIKNVLLSQWYSANVIYMKRLIFFPNVEEESITLERKWMKENIGKIVASDIPVKLKIGAIIFILPVKLMTNLGNLYRAFEKRIK